MKKKPLALWIFAGLALGIAAGMLLMGRPDIAEIYIKPFGTLFLNLLKFIVVPIVLFSIMNGVISMKDIKKVGSIGGKTVIYYMCTTFFAVTMGLLIANLFKKGFPVLSTSSLEYTAAETPSFIQTLIGIFPSNIIQPMAEASMLQVIVVALLFGFGTIVAGKKGEVFGNFVESANDVSIAVLSDYACGGCQRTPDTGQPGLCASGGLYRVHTPRLIGVFADRKVSCGHWTP